MNILVSSNKKYLSPLIVTLYSLSLNTNYDINVYFINVSVTEQDMNWFRNKINKISKISLNIIDVNYDFLFNLKIKDHFAIETYSRLLLMDILPEDIDRILWLDADIAIHNSIDDLYNYQLDGYSLLACKSINQDDKENRIFLGIDDDQLYFNAGVILFNLDFMRKNISSNTLIDFTVKNNGKLKWLDQDVLNACLGNTALIIDYKKYNYMHFSGTYFSKEERKTIKNDNSILHYIGAIKPWDYRFDCYTVKFWNAYAFKSGGFSSIYLIKIFFKRFIYMIKKTMIAILKRLYHIIKLICIYIKHRKIHVMSSEKTIQYILSNKKSVCRFGDGEMFIIDKESGCGFQDVDDNLSEKLLESLNDTNNDKILICVPKWMFNHYEVSLRTLKSRKWCYRYLLNHSQNWLSKVSTDYNYGDSSFNRRYISIRNKKTAFAYFDMLKSIWQDRDVCFIEGEKTRLGVGNDLFDNAKSIIRILAPSQNAFNKLSEIKEVASNVSKDVLFLIALGPTATVLCRDLANMGYQAIDIGHIDVEYEWLLMGAKEVVPIKNKYVNESKIKYNQEEFDDDKYNSEIKYRIL